MNRRSFVWTLAASILALTPIVEAQQGEKLARVGVLFIGGKDQPHLESFRQGLRDLGYVEGKNIILVYRYAEGNEDRLGALTAELVREKVDSISSHLKVVHKRGD